MLQNKFFIVIFGKFYLMTIIYLIKKHKMIFNMVDITYIKIQLNSRIIIMMEIALHLINYSGSKTIYKIKIAILQL